MLRSRWMPDKSEVVAEEAMVVAKHPLAAEAGIDILKAGGNAMDAAVAMAFVMCVVKPMMTGIGGIGYVVAHDGRTGDAFVVEGPPRAPLAATPDMYEVTDVDTRGIALYRVKDDANDRGYRAVAVPGNVALLCAAHRRLGQLPLAAVLEPAIGIAEDGFVPDWFTTLHIGNAMPDLARSPAAAAVFLPGGFPPRFNDDPPKLRQADLGRTLRLIVRDSAGGFYRGEVAEAIEADFRAHGGLITRDDLAAYEARVVAPFRGRYRDLEVLIPRMPCGATTALETLNIMDRFNLRAAGHNTVEGLHLFVECARRAFADRFSYLGDPEVVPVPLQGILSGGHADELAAGIDPKRASAVPADAEPWVHFATTLPASDPWKWDPQTPSGPAPAAAPPAADDTCTTHLAAVDGERNAVACTITAAGLFGARVMTAGTGILWNNGMTWFNPLPGAANSIAPGKRAVTNMTPIILRRRDRPVLAVGAPGGRKIINAITQVIANVVDHGLGTQAAVTAPRVDASASVVLADARLDAAVVEGLRERGHRVEVVEESPAASSFARPLTIAIDADGRLHSGLAPFHIAEARGL
jgi:gamma-glutamyltranspeptidase/glutathione hydrolase